jgi:hypothetical protein
MPSYELTEDEAYWVAVAIENSKDTAQLRATALYNLEGGMEREDIEDASDFELLIRKYTELQEKFPLPLIGE